MAGFENVSGQLGATPKKNCVACNGTQRCVFCGVHEGQTKPADCQKCEGTRVCTYCKEPDDAESPD